MSEPHGVWVNFHVRQKHSAYMDPIRYARFVEALGANLPTGLDPESLARVEEHLARPSGEDVLINLTSEDTWSDTTAADLDGVEADTNDYSHLRG